MFGGDYEAKVREEFDLVLKNFQGIKDYHVAFVIRTNIFSKDKFHVRMWINEELYNVHNVTNILSNEGDLKDNLKEIAKKINSTVTFDIYSN